LSASYETLVCLILPEGILEYFELINVSQTETGLNIYLEEKNIVPADYENKRLESKGFLPETRIQDFPIRGHKVTLCIKRRRWEVKETAAIITRDWNLVRKGGANDNGIRHFFKRYIWIITQSVAIY